MLWFLLACAEEGAPPAEEAYPETYCSFPEDEDADGFSTAAGDCDDRDASVYPGKAEACNDLDDDCDGDVDDCGCPEACNGLDDDCDGEVDEDFSIQTWLDLDGDGYGNPLWYVSTCEGVENGDDCDDADAGVHPGAEEFCDDVDQDCAGDADGGTCDALDCSGETRAYWNGEPVELTGVFARHGDLWLCPGTWQDELLLSGPLAVRGIGEGVILTGGVRANGTLLLRDLTLTAPDIAVSSTGDVTLNGVTISCAARGVVADGAIVARNSTFSDISAPNGLGAALSTSAGDVSVEGCTFTDNTAGVDDTVWASGAAIATMDGDIAITTSTFVGNVATTYGGAVCSYSGAVVATHSTFTDNTAGVGGAIWAGTGPLSCDGNTWSDNLPNDASVGAEPATCE